MIRLLVVAFFLSVHMLIWAQTFIAEPNDSTSFVEYNDGKQWIYRTLNGITVGITNEEFEDGYGKYYQIGIFIKNNQDTAFIFNPEEVFAELLSSKGDTISLEVYTNEKYQNKIKKAQTLEMILYGIASGFNAASAGYTTTYSTSYSPSGYISTSINRSYDANAAYQANMAANMQLQALGDRMENDRAVRVQGYLKLNTVHSGDAIIGYMNIKHKKGKSLLVSLNIGECTFSYLWDVEKKKKKKSKK